MFRVGLISDTHGLLRPEAAAFLRGCDHIVHGGDVCDASVLEQLAALAPLTVVRGNNDHGDWAEPLRTSERLQVGGVSLYAVHDLADLDIEPRAAGVHVVISGHSHRPKIVQRDGVLYVNPGSAGPRRFRLPLALGEIRIEGRVLTARILELGGEPAVRLIDQQALGRFGN